MRDAGGDMDGCERSELAVKTRVWRWRPVSSDSIHAFIDRMKVREKGGIRTINGFRADSVTGTNFVVCSYIRIIVTKREVKMAG